MANNNPLRMCAVCRGRFPKADMLRLVRNSGEYGLDSTGKADGRGCYICNKHECISRAEKAKAIQRSFKSCIPTELYRKLEEYDNKPQG